MEHDLSAISSKTSSTSQCGFTRALLKLFDIFKPKAGNNAKNELFGND